MPKVFAAVKAVIIKGNKFLIIKEIINNKTVQDLPGGKIEYGESPYNTLHREVSEEVGLEIKIVKLFGLYWFFKTLDKKQIVCHTFLCQPKNNKVNLANNPAKDENILEYKWVTKNEFLKNHTENIDQSLIELIKKL